MDLLLIAFLGSSVICLLSTTILFLRRYHRLQLVLLNKNLELEEYKAQLKRQKREIHDLKEELTNLRVLFKAEQAKKRELTVDALRALEDLRFGGCLLRVEAINPEAVFMWSPSDSKG